MSSQYDRDSLAVIPGIGITYAEYAKIIELNTNINLRVGMPAHVLRWRGPIAAGNKSKPAMVDVQPHFIATIAINSPDELTEEEIAAGWVLLEEESGYAKQRALPAISNVTVHYSGSAGMLNRGKLRVGEVGWLKFADRSIDKWAQVGGPIDPGYQQFHDLSDAIFEPGLRFGKVAMSVDDTKNVIGPEDGSAGFEIDDVEAPNLPGIAMRTTGDTATVESAVSVLLGAAATLGVARLTDDVAASGSMTTFMNAVVAALNTIAAAVPVVIFPPVPPTTIGQISEASTKVKAE